MHIRKTKRYERRIKKIAFIYGKKNVQSPRKFLIEILQRSAFYLYYLVWFFTYKKQNFIMSIWWQYRVLLAKGILFEFISNRC